MKDKNLLLLSKMQFSFPRVGWIGDYSPDQILCVHIFQSCFACSEKDLSEGPRPSDVCDEHW